jgi:hypothetical protein
MTKLIRVFPRKTSASPEDADVRFGPPGLFDQADAVQVSATWTWDKPRAEALAEAWRAVTDNVQVGGPAYDDPGGEFEPGKFLKRGYVMTSRGCPNHCWFCVVPRREGAVREIAVTDGWNVLDSNLLACSRPHIEHVFAMLARQPERARFTGGLEAARLEGWHVDALVKLNPKLMYFAYDEPRDWEPLQRAAKMLGEAGLIRAGHNVRCYCLIGWERDTIEKAEKRLRDTANLGIMPMAMLFDHGAHRKNDQRQWAGFQREWANSFIVGSKMREAVA